MRWLSTSRTCFSATSWMRITLAPSLRLRPRQRRRRNDRKRTAGKTSTGFQGPGTESRSALSDLREPGRFEHGHHFGCHEYAQVYGNFGLLGDVYRSEKCSESFGTHS